MATSALLKTDTEDLKELLSNGKFYEVPPYQRDYSWKQEHWEDLWADLLNVEQSGEDHYMGAIVLESGERKQYRIIDGQQRMATLSVLILACVDLLYKFAEEGVDDEANRERAALLESSYVGSKDPTTLRVTPKLRLNANDNKFFQLNIAQRKAPPGGLRNVRDSERLMWECFQFYQSRVSDAFYSDKNGEKVAAFVSEIVTERLIFISVTVQDQLSAYTVFETLNARGLELTESDLLKNYLFSLADRLSRSQMEQVQDQWARITDRVSIAKFPEFLRHHRNSRREYVRQKQLFKVIKREVTEMEHVFELLDKLEEDAVWFDALRDHNSEFWLDYEDACEHVRVLTLFGVSQYIPLLLAAKDMFRQRQDVVEVLRYCAVLSLRFNGISKRSTHILEEVYNRAALELRKSEVPDLRKVRLSLKPIYIPDKEFEDDFAELRMKNRGTSRKRLRYLLAAIERQISGSDISDASMKATVEHILPENPDPAKWGQITSEELERSVERLGNYSLLEFTLNSRLAANDRFESKRRAYEQSRYQLSRELAEYEDWSADTIAERQRKMARTAKSVWKLEY